MQKPKEQNIFTELLNRREKSEKKDGEIFLGLICLTLVASMLEIYWCPFKNTPILVYKS